MTGPPPLRVGLVGAGQIASSYAQVFERCPLARVVGVADVDGDAAHRLATQLGASAHASADDLTAAEDLDAVVVCTPPATHADIVLGFLEQGVPVLCEKPLTLDLLTARDLIVAAGRAGVLLTMGAKFRYVDDVVRARQLVADGAIGDVVLLENSFTTRVDMTRRWNSDPAVSGGGVLIDNGTHSADIVRYFLGPIRSVMAVEGKRAQGLAVEDTARMFVQSVDGVMGSVDLSWSIDKELDWYLQVYGTEGTIRVGWHGSSLRHAGSDDWVDFGCGYDKLAAMGRQVENFCCALRQEEELVITAEDAIASVGVIEAAYASLGQDHWVPVPRLLHVPHDGRQPRTA